MYLPLRKTHGYEYLILMESIHVKGQKYCAKRVIKNYGRYDQLPENVRRDYEDRKARKTLSRQLEHEFRMQELQKSQTRLEQQNVAAAFCPNKGLALNYGHLPFRMIWDRELGLKYKIGYLQNKKTDIRSWQLNDLLFYLSACRVFQPMSYYQASVCRGDFFYCPWNSGEFSLQVQDPRRSYGVLRQSIPVPFSTREPSSAGCLSGTLPSNTSHAG